MEEAGGAGGAEGRREEDEEDFPPNFTSVLSSLHATDATPEKY